MQVTTPKILEEWERKREKKEGVKRGWKKMWKNGMRQESASIVINFYNHPLSSSFSIFLYTILTLSQFSPPFSLSFSEKKYPFFFLLLMWRRDFRSLEQLLLIFSNNITTLLIPLFLSFFLLSSFSFFLSFPYHLLSKESLLHEGYREGKTWRMIEPRWCELKKGRRMNWNEKGRKRKKETEHERKWEKEWKRMKKGYMLKLQKNYN